MRRLQFLSTMPQAKDNNFLHPGTRLGAERQYLILKPLGNGGFGKTYLARNTKFGDGGPQLVIKEFFMLRKMHRDEHSSRALVSNPINQATVNEFRAKFIREAQRIYQLSHPGIVRVTDIINDENDTSYYVMDYVGSQSLNDLLKQRGVLPEAEAVDYVCQVLEALRVVHANRMLHLDVKPSNIMLNAQGRVVLIDFGASKIENFKGKISSTPMALSRGFASPEQISGSLKHIDPRADIYAVGATLYNLLTSNVVRDPMDLLQDKDAAFVFPLSVSEHVRRAVVRMMAYNSSDRPATVDEALALLRTAAADFTYADSTADLSLQKMLEMVEVEGGTFTMGATSEQGSDAQEGKKPAHQVTLSSFSIGKYEVTQALWQEIMGSNPSNFKGDNLPVENVSWDDCQEFLRKLNARKGEFGITDGRTFRLPTEAEWEYAARGGNLSKGFKYSGSNNIVDVAWCDEDSGNTHPVGTKQPNELGIYDMSGNVWEWCQDWFGDYSSGAQTNPQGPASGFRRVIRGGCWFGYAQDCRVSFRYFNLPGRRGNCLGLRLVLNVSKPFEQPKPKPQPTPQPVRLKKNKGNLVLLLSALAGMVIVIGIMLGVRQCGGGEAPAYDSYADSTADMSIQDMLEMVEVEGGTFTMGATSEQGSDADDDEKTTHQVTLSTFSIGKYEVTQALWQEIMGSNPSEFKGDLQPVVNVSWDDCQKFLRKLNARKGEFGITDGRTFHLPTEAEWEYAARGGKLSKGFKYSGSNNIGDVAWYYGNSGFESHPVGTKQPNELGIYDMSGNVWEWCQDCFGDYSSGAQTNPQGPASGSSRVNRGGSWYYYAQDCRVSFRNDYAPDCRRNYLGLRLVLKFP